MKTTTFLLSLFFALTAFAQDYDFGKVSKEELAEKFNPLDSSANAAYLYKYRKTYLQYDQNEGFQLITDIHNRIKIYNQEGYDYATVEVYLYKSGSDDEDLSDLKGYTYNLVDGKIEETKLQKDGIFDSEYNKYRNLTKFTMPNISNGSVIEYKYTIVSPFISYVHDFVFQHDIPVKKIEASFESPEYFNYKINIKGYYPVDPKYETSSKKITIHNKPKFGTAPGGARSSYSSSALDFFSNKTSFNLENVPALKEEPYVNNIDNYRSAISYELSYVKYPNSPYDYYATTWEDVVKTIYESSSFGDELNKTGYFENDIDGLTSSVSDPMARVGLILDFVKTKVKWNNYIGKYTDVGVRKAYKDQVGNVAEINLMLTAMLRHAGLNANPVLVSTRQNGIPLFPTLDGYDYVISAVETPNGVILMDATNNYSTPNILPFRTLNWEGRIVRKNKTSSTINLYPSEHAKNSVTMLANLNESGGIQGNYRSIKTNHDAMLYREKYLETDKNQFLENLENEHNGMKISNLEIKNDHDLYEPLTESYEFSLESQADVIGDKLYFSPMVFLKTVENPFKLENREFPVDFGYSGETNYRIIIKLPEGYKIETMPESAAVIMPDNLAEFRYNISGNNLSVQLVVSAKINEPILAPLYYEALKEYFDKFIEKEAEQIVLVKN